MTTDVRTIALARDVRLFLERNADPAEEPAHHRGGIVTGQRWGSGTCSRSRRVAVEGAGGGDASDAAHQAAAVGTGSKGIVSAGRWLVVGRGRCAIVRLPADLSFEQIPNTSEIGATLALG
jgi:hypothetical protein